MQFDAWILLKTQKHPLFFVLGLFFCVLNSTTGCRFNASDVGGDGSISVEIKTAENTGASPTPTPIPTSTPAPVAQNNNNIIGGVGVGAPLVIA